jgi:integrase/recombinase XerD
MLKDLFVRALPHFESSPHVADLELFATSLDSGCYSWHSKRRHVRRLYRALSAATSTPLSILSADELGAIFDGWPNEGYVGTKRLFYRFLLERDRLIESATCEPRHALKKLYLKRLVDLRGLSPNTVAYIDWALKDFLNYVLKPDDAVSLITPQAIDDFFQFRKPQLARRTFHHTVCSLRSFLRFCFECGALPQALHEFELPMSFRFEQPPRALQWRYVEAMLASINRSTFAGNRDYTIFHLLAFYGLRPGEVAALTIDSINWQAGTLRVQQSKTHSSLILPLSPTTLDILREHLGRRRVPSPHLQLFMCDKAPYGPMNNVAISVRFKGHARRSGLPIADASAYALRHSFAMRLLDGGVGIQAIGDLMGHKSMASTSAYLRIQTDMLREVALDVPVEGRAQ